MEGKIDLLDLSFNELMDQMNGIQVEKFRAKQVYEWLYKGVTSFDEMTNISRPIREKLAQLFSISSMKILEKKVSKLDGTVKYLFELSDSNALESVLMHYKHGATACLSTQIGCKMGCSFCASTEAGFVRNLTSGEMIAQLLCIQKDLGLRISNVVLMGIGEPLDNYSNVLKFLRLINSPEGLNIGMRHISLSTCGLVPEIIKLSKENIQITLSISLHAPNDQLRQKIMPIANTYSIDKILEACKIYTGGLRRRITFEYALISDINDSIENALELAKRLKGMLCHVNLIPINAVAGTGYTKTPRQRAQQFQSILMKHGLETTIRRELGSDIEAACGQLRRNRNK